MAFVGEFFPELLFVSVDRKIDNVKQLPVFASHSPSGASVQCIDHFSQIIRNKRFAYYDYGRANNIRAYGKEEPPLIELEKIKKEMAPPVLIVAGSEDKLAKVKDINWIRSVLEEEGVLRKYV